MTTARQSIVSFAVALTLLAAGSSPAAAGPPLICHPFDPGTATVLPWGAGAGWNTPDRAYDVSGLTSDVLALLSPDAPILARMENLRRATIYASRDPRVAAALLTALVDRTRAGAGESHDPLAWFDAGYLVESYRQARGIATTDMLSGPERASWSRWVEPSPDGYAWVRKALALTGGSAEMEYAASLMKTGAVSAEHRRRAVAGARAGSLLARNLDRQ